MCLDCSGMITENSAICVFYLIRYFNSVLLVTLIAILLSNTVDIEWEISRLANSGKFPSGVTVPIVFHSDGWLAKAVNVSVVVSGIVKSSSVITAWGFAVVSLEVVLTFIVNCGKCIRPCVVWMATLLFLIKCNPKTCPLISWITTKCSANSLSPISKSGVAVANGSFNWIAQSNLWSEGFYC